MEFQMVITTRILHPQKEEEKEGGKGGGVACGKCSHGKGTFMGPEEPSWALRAFPWPAESAQTYFSTQARERHLHGCLDLCFCRRCSGTHDSLPCWELILILPAGLG